ncbi:HAD-IA family hydrolase [Streptomyces sp. NPDC056683]|uniref:HAD family hydrolase n=1 Tax=Streptomyces sp. NPDC056683 TaxID=3345910 RepID=UPI00369188AE
MALAVVTSGGPTYADDHLTRCRITGHLTTVVNAEDVLHGKPDPEGYLLACRRLGVAPGEAVVFEDSAAGPHAGRRAGARCFAVGHAPGRPACADWPTTRSRTSRRHQSSAPPTPTRAGTAPVPVRPGNRRHRHLDRPERGEASPRGRPSIPIRCGGPTLRREKSPMAPGRASARDRNHRRPARITRRASNPRSPRLRTGIRTAPPKSAGTACHCRSRQRSPCYPRVWPDGPGSFQPPTTTSAPPPPTVTDRHHRT